MELYVVPILVDEETGETAAVVRGMVFGLKKCFVLETMVPCSPGFEVLVVTTAMAIYEKKRRGQTGLEPLATFHAPRRAGRAGAAMNAVAGSNAGGMGAAGF